MKSLLCALVAAVVASLPAGVAASEINDAFRQVLRNPTDIQANLRYARLAEATGNPRWALATYERILAIDPNNQEARQGLQRVRVAILPNTTIFTAELGGAWESNARQRQADLRSEGQGYATTAMRDERSLAGVRWRTTGAAIGIYHGTEHELNYGYAGLNTGPVIDLAPDLTVNPAIGGGAAYFDQRLYYGEGVGSVTFDGLASGSPQSVRLRVAYRDYNDFFPTQHGVYADATGRFTFPNAFDDSIVILSPWLRWSELKGTATGPATFVEVQPGAYTEVGGRVEVNTLVAPGLIVGANVALSERYYRSDLATDGLSKRRDTWFAPGTMVLLPKFFAAQTGLRVEYTYLWNTSNLDERRYVDHLVTAAVVSRF